MVEKYWISLAYIHLVIQNSIFQVIILNDFYQQSLLIKLEIARKLRVNTYDFWMSIFFLLGGDSLHPRKRLEKLPSLSPPGSAPKSMLFHTYPFPALIAILAR